MWNMHKERVLECDKCVYAPGMERSEVGGGGRERELLIRPEKVYRSR